MVRVYVSLTTTPRRAPHIGAAILSILEQTLQPDLIIVGMPAEYVRFPNEACELPAWLASHPKLHFHELDADYGPASKLVTGLEYAKIHSQDPETFVVTVDDDISYSPGMLETLMSKARDLRGRAVGYRGFNISEPRADGTVAAIAPSRLVSDVQILEGFSMIAYPAPLLGVDSFKAFLIGACVPNEAAFLSDDLTISFYLTSLGVRRVAIDPRVTAALFASKRILTLGLGGDALHLGQPMLERYASALKHLCEWKRECT